MKRKNKDLISQIGQNLFDARLDANLTQKELYKLSGVSVPVIIGLERGNKTGVRLTTVIRLADALGVSIERLIK